jgi:hypothetical protein
MAVWYRQTADGEVSDEREIARHFDGQTDAELLAAKAQGATDKGWDVTWTGERSFTATKDRWGGVRCVRDFWAD